MPSRDFIPGDLAPEPSLAPAPECAVTDRLASEDEDITRWFVHHEPHPIYIYSGKRHLTTNFCSMGRLFLGGLDF